MRLADITLGSKVVFTVRDPIARYVSGFNTRLRQGQPRFFNKWSPVQAEGFVQFPTANSLAEGLSDPDMDRRYAAMRLLRDMIHTGVPLSFWLGSPDYLASRCDDILLLMQQEFFDEDFVRLKRLIGLPASLSLPDNLVDTHRTPPGFDISLSARAVYNLTQWYAGDFAIFETARDLRQRILDRV